MLLGGFKKYQLSLFIIIFYAIAVILLNSVFFFGIVKISFHNSTISTNSFKNNDKFEPIITSRHEWTLNVDFLQYSSIIFIEKNQNIILEVLALLNYENESEIYENKKNISCLLLAGNNELRRSGELFEIIKIPLMYKKTNYSVIDLWKFKCKIINNSKIYDSYKVAIINQFSFETVPKSLIKYQQATIYTDKIEKKAAIANCVHLVRDLEGNRFKNLLNWLELQFKIEMKQITLYFFKPNEQVKKYLVEKYPNKRVIIVDYKTSKNDICKYEMSLNLNSTINRVLFDICEKSFNKHFTMSRGYVLYGHERINDNDCFMHYKYEYEYVTNFDFDDLVFPRYYNTNDFALNDSCTKNKSISNYSIYDYAKRLFNKYGSKASCLLFKHVLFITIDQKLFIESIKLKNETITLENNHNGLRHMFFNVSAENYKYLNYLLDAYKAYSCLNITNNKFTMEWNNPFGVVFDKRSGKSIFHTGNTEGVMQHFTYNSVHGTRIVDVPIIDGFTGHYRESIWFFFQNHYQSIENFFIDIEYYKFLSTFYFIVN